jgi:hypothetical protein
MAVAGRAPLAALAPLFLVSLATVGFEISLTRYFAVAKWSEYGYWVISIVLAGFALSGVVMALARDALARRSPALLTALPVALIAAASVGFHFVTTNPFNPLQLQNQATFVPQLWDIGGYYVALLPFFFLAGLYISLCFVAHDRDLGRVYGFDLTGAGVGALVALALMWLVHPFHLVPCLLAPLAAASLFAPRRRMAAIAAAVALLAAGEALLLGDDEAAFNDFKAIYAPLHVPDSRTVAELRSPRGLYMLLDDFTERVDTDVSNDAGMLGLPGPPNALGLYRDGNRIAALPKAGGLAAGYAAGTLSALPYALLDHPKVLLAGSSGGFRIAEARQLGAGAVDATEPEPIVNHALRDGMGPAPAFPPTPGVRILNASPIAIAAAGAKYDLIDISSDFLDSAEANTSAFAEQAIATYLAALSPDGIVSIPVSIREFPAYAVRVLATVRGALMRAGIADPLRHVLVYRSAWNVRVLVSPLAFDIGRIAAAQKFCGDRSFDLSYYPGIDVAAARAGIYNDLPPVSFAAGEVASGEGPQDAIADEAGAALAGEATASSEAFNLAPITYDRPSYYAVLRLEQIGTILRRIEILPQAEVGPLVNIAVLAQAVVIALIVLAVPLVGRVRAEARSAAMGTLRAIVYFAALGLGFLFIEIFLIERASFYLNDRISAFALVLTAMLICSGGGSMMAGRFDADPRRGLWLAAAAIVAWCALLLAGLQPLMLATLGWPWFFRAAVMLAVVAPGSVALGLPFPLGLSRAGPTGFLPWAWGLNGAFSVVATPLANLIALEFGFDRVLLIALLLYVTVAIGFPSLRRKLQWQDIPAA